MLKVLSTCFLGQIPKPFWGEAMCAACNLNSRSPFSSFGGRCSRESVNREKRFHTLMGWCLGAKFASICLKSKDKKIDDKAIPCIFLGSGEESVAI